MSGLFGDNAQPAIGLGLRIETVADFNRRALIAMEGVRYGENTQAPGIVASCRLAFNARRPISDRQQAALYSIVHRYRKQLTDTLVIEYAAAQIKGAD